MPYGWFKLSSGATALVLSTPDIFISTCSFSPSVENFHPLFFFAFLFPTIFLALFRQFFFAISWILPPFSLHPLYSRFCAKRRSSLFHQASFISAYRSSVSSRIAIFGSPGVHFMQKFLDPPLCQFSFSTFLYLLSKQLPILHLSTLCICYPPYPQSHSSTRVHSFFPPFTAIFCYLSLLLIAAAFANWNKLILLFFVFLIVTILLPHGHTQLEKIFFPFFTNLKSNIHMYISSSKNAFAH